MINKAANIIVMLMLLFGTTGLNITRHYCSGNLVSTSVFTIPEKCCQGSCPGCRDENIKFRITDQYESSQVKTDLKPGPTSLFEKHSLPILLSLPGIYHDTNLNNTGRIQKIKTLLARSGPAERSPSFLQVFLF